MGNAQIAWPRTATQTPPAAGVPVDAPCGTVTPGTAAAGLTAPALPARCAPDLGAHTAERLSKCVPVVGSTTLIGC